MLAAACPSCLIKPGGLCQRLDVKIERREAREGLTPSCALTCALPAVRLLLEELELDDSGRVEDDVTDLAVEHAAVFRQKPRSIWVALMASRRSAASPK
jgi:hypothetical protein